MLQPHFSREAALGPGALLGLPVLAARALSPWEGRPKVVLLRGEGRGARVRHRAPGSPARPASPGVSSSSRVRSGLSSFFGSISTPRLGGRQTCLVLATDAGRSGTQPFASGSWAGGCEVSMGGSEAWLWGPWPRVRAAVARGLL